VSGRKTDPKLSPDQVREALAGLEGWRGKDRRTAITKTYSLPTFRTAVAFVAFVGELAEAADHHPDIDIRYTRVTLVLSTHSAGGLTSKDFALARRVDGFS